MASRTFGVVDHNSATGCTTYKCAECNGLVTQNPAGADTLSQHVCQPIEASTDAEPPQSDFVMALQRELAFFFGRWHSNESGHRADGLACMENECVRIRRLTLAATPSTLSEAEAEQKAREVIADWHDYKKWRDPSMMPIPPFSGAQEDELKRLIVAALRSVPVEWQPIASAPHGQRILALVGGKPEWVYGAVGDEQQEWTFDDTGELCHPTHWMPLPSPPTEEKK